MTKEERVIFATTLGEVCSEMWTSATAASVEGSNLMLTIPNPGMVVSSIGLAGDEFRGALVTMAKPEFFNVTYPLELRKNGVREEHLADWAGEVSNQLLGRMKNRLCQVGLHFNVSSPTVVRGETLLLSEYTRVTAARHAICVSGERADIFFDIVHDQGKPLLLASGPIIAAVSEGESLLF